TLTAHWPDPGQPASRGWGSLGGCLTTGSWLSGEQPGRMPATLGSVRKPEAAYRGEDSWSQYKLRYTGEHRRVLDPVSFLGHSEAGHSPVSKGSRSPRRKVLGESDTGTARHGSRPA